MKTKSPGGRGIGSRLTAYSPPVGRRIVPVFGNGNGNGLGLEFRWEGDPASGRAGDPHSRIAA
jgi:hypothetical protein